MDPALDAVAVQASAAALVLAWVVASEEDTITDTMDIMAAASAVPVVVSVAQADGKPVEAYRRRDGICLHGAILHGTDEI